MSEESSKFLSPNTIKSNLMLSSLYLTAYELLKSAIIENISNFFIFEYRDGKAIRDKQYKDEVTQVHKDILYASCLWLKRNEVITDVDIQEIEDIRKHRNQVAHELPRLLIDSHLNLNVEYFLRIRELLEKIELWWIENVEIPSNSDFDDEVVLTEDIHPGRIVVLDHIVSSALIDYLDEEQNSNLPFKITGE